MLSCCFVAVFHGLSAKQRIEISSNLRDTLLQILRKTIRDTQPNAMDLMGFRNSKFHCQIAFSPSD